MTASIGFVVGLVAGGVLVDTVGWRGVFFVNVPLCLALAIVAPSALPGGTTTAGVRRLDLPGALLVTAGMATLVYTPTVGTRDGWASVEFAACVLASAALLAAFVQVERRGRQPILPLSILRHHTLVIGDTLMVLVGALMAGEVLVLTLYAQQVLGYSPLVSGLIAIPQGIGGLLRGLVAARLLDRAGLRWFLAANWALAALSILVLFRFPATSHYPLLGIVLLGVGFGSTNVIFGGTIAGSAGVSNDEQGSARRPRQRRPPDRRSHRGRRGPLGRGGRRADVRFGRRQRRRLSPGPLVLGWGRRGGRRPQPRSPRPATHEPRARPDPECAAAVGRPPCADLRTPT